MTYTVHRVDFEESGGPETLCSRWRQWGKGEGLHALLVYTGEPLGMGAWAQEATHGLWLWKFTQGQRVDRRLSLNAD